MTLSDTIVAAVKACNGDATKISQPYNRFPGGPDNSFHLTARCEKQIRNVFDAVGTLKQVPYGVNDELTMEIAIDFDLILSKMRIRISKYETHKNRPDKIWIEWKDDFRVESVSTDERTKWDRNNLDMTFENMSDDPSKVESSYAQSGYFIGYEYGIETDNFSDGFGGFDILEDAPDYQSGLYGVVDAFHRFCAKHKDRDFKVDDND